MVFDNFIAVGGVYYVLDADSKTARVEFKSDNKYISEVVIPESIKFKDVEYSVTSIGNCAFFNCADLTAVSIPNSITTIGDEAFSGCIDLISVAIPNSVTSIGDNAFSGCSGLTSVTFPDSVTTIGNYVFSGCSSLTSVAIPNSVTSIGDYAFAFCSDLTSVTFPDSLTTIGNDAFCDCGGLTSVPFPETVTSIGDYAFYGCSGLTSVTIPESATTIGVGAFYGCSGLTSIKISENIMSIGAGAFHGCIGLTSIISEILEPFETYCFGDWQTVFDNVDLYVPLASLALYENTSPWCNFSNIIPIGMWSSSAELKISADNDVQIGEGDNVKIVWYNEDMVQIGTGSSIGGIEDGTKIYYSVLLDETLGREYREVNQREAVIEDGIITCRLEKIGRVKLEGRISAVDIDENPANLQIVQKLNGKYEENLSAQTGEKGSFSIEVYDDETDVTISRPDCFSTSIHRDQFGESGNVGTIPLNLISGVAVSVNLFCTPTVKSGESSEKTSVSGGLENFDLIITNVSTSTEIVDFVVQNNKVIIKSGAIAGNSITMNVKSKQGLYSDADTSFVIEEGENSVLLELTELGGLCATYSSSNNGADVGYVYNADGELVGRGDYVGNELIIPHLPSGIYTLISMKKSQLLGSLSSLPQYNNIGLIQGTDYILSSVNVDDGKLSSVDVGIIPSLNEAKFYHTTGNTYFVINKSNVTVGRYLTLESHIELKEKIAKDLSDISLIVDLPKGCQMVDNSVIINRIHTSYSQDGNRIMVPLTKENYQGRIRFCIVPVEIGDYTITAYASLTSKEHILQPIGTAQLTTKGFFISAPEMSLTTNVVIKGTALGESAIRIYDNDVLIGTTTSNADGSWAKECELDRPFNNSFHEVYAKIMSSNSMELYSETKLVEYSNNHIVPKKVTMSYYNGWYKRNIDVIFDLMSGTTTPSSFPFYQTTDFTFVAEFTKNDPEKIKNVAFKVLASDGTIRTLPAVFDDKIRAWVATCEYSSNKLPQNVTVDYISLTPPTDENHEDGILDQATNLVNVTNHINQFVQNNASTKLMQEDESSLSFLQSLIGDDAYVSKIEEIDFTVAEQLMKQHQFVYYDGEDGSIGTYTEWDDDKIELICADLGQKCALRISLAYSSINTRKIGDRRSGPRAPTPLNREWVDLLGIGGGILVDIVGATDYISVRSDLDNMLKLIRRYTDDYNRIRSDIISDMLAKCPDGSSRYPESYMRLTYTDISGISSIEDDFSKKYYEYIEEYKRRLRASVITDISTAFVGVALSKVASLTKVWTSRASRCLRSLMSRRTHLETSASVLSSSLGLALECAVAGADVITDYKNFQKTRDNLLSWAYSQNYIINIKYSEIKQRIKDNSKKCKMDDEENEEDDVNENEDEKEKDYMYEEKYDDKTIEFPAPASQGILDPSGYVYEAVTSNRLVGVTATVYYKDTQEDMYGDKTDVAIKWDAENYSQQNPLITDAAGFYRWDVPQGMWQVKYEKEGYETTYSDWLPVPPPQLDVNIGMRQATAPSVSKMKGYESGIVIDMSKYMRPATFGDGSVTVMRNGVAEKGSVIMLNVEKDPTGDVEFASKLKFIPENQFKTSDEVVVTVHQAVESYCNVPMDADHVETVMIESEIKEIVADDEMSVAYQGSKDLTVLVLPIEASAGRKLNIKTSSSVIVSIDQNQVTIDNEGKASFTINGELLGGAYLTYEVDDTDVVETSKIKVVERDDLVATPEASIKSGNAVVKGTLLTLTCETEGATIYYTLDGSCPCDLDKRIKYTAPFALYPDVTVKAIAVKSGWNDSEIATFVYCAQAENIAISSAKQVTYMSDKDLDFTGYPDLKAYVATGYDKSSGTIWLTRVKEVPANTGFLLMGEADTYEIPVKAGGFSAYYQNMFKGTIEGTTIQTTDGDNTNYYLSNGDAGVGFYKVQGSVELKPNRAYLSVPTEIPAVGAAGNTETIKVTAAGQVPYYNSQSLDFSSLDAQGVKAYTATGYDYNSGTIWLTRVKQVPAETGILIMAPQGEYPVPTASVASVYANMFKGTLTGTTIQTHETIAGEDYINYYLSSGDAGVGFYKVTKEGGVTIGANRCYLPIKNKEVAGTRSASSGRTQIVFEEADEVISIPLFRGIGDDNGGTTNLTPALSKGEGEWYNLQGQRVSKPGKGLYIRNGKKVVIK